MKFMFLTMALVWSVYANGVQSDFNVDADGFESLVVTSVNVSSCHWIPVTSGDGRNVFACTSYPRRAQAADYSSTTRAIQRLESKINQLEMRIAELEMEK